jgi:uncharacterized protein YijF (DUF1287 family)
MTTSLTRTILFATLLALAATAQQPPLPTMIAGAKKQVGVTRSYDPTYRRIGYPNGDVPRETGVCTDVVIRAYRHAGVDLQVLVHEDMKAAFASYPKTWGLRRTDTNIDHRRVPNLATFFTRKGKSLPVTRRGGDYQSRRRRHLASLLGRPAHRRRVGCAACAAATATWSCTTSAPVRRSRTCCSRTR